METLMDEARKTIELVCSFNAGIVMKVVPPNLIIHHDDSVQFVIRNANDTPNGNKKIQIYLTHVKSVEHKGIEAIHIKPVHKAATADDIRIKQCYFINIYGKKAVPFYIVSGMGPSASSNLDNSGYGFVFFCQSDEHMGETRY